MGFAVTRQDVTLKLHNVSIESVLDAVKKQTFVNMLYNSQMFRAFHRIYQRQEREMGCDSEVDIESARV
jgi:hypothetical protein